MDNFLKNRFCFVFETESSGYELDENLGDSQLMLLALFSKNS